MTSDVFHDHEGKPLSYSDSEKRRLEREAARLFMRAYEHEFHQPMRHIWHNEPTKPDISCFLQGQSLDLEIAHLYASEQEAAIAAKDLHTKSHQDQYHGEEHLWAFLTDLASMDSSHKLHTALSRILHSKARKHYNTQRCWLIIRNASPLWGRKDFLQVLPHISIPANPFEKIWLLSDFRGTDPLLQLQQ
ncbi:hypothetical protein ACQUQU_07660 [Thalassolituus sp. LLYu03]|uniref:hypothetical protein n=1 Tax=Thalassolituus sp. LLYu03 TaxID=3421656 RepID=UPI003D281A5B